ncbi:hypothetical protein PUNSTDRAFT_137246 [Punctularia strigosozonata HHB-11173 SS5]|uniref:uncharacterized protein n=1 Tax=Punctularia strigosozonata (strain HHB-11173) TaxID=741275 RepID=UPI0004416CDB|nr:uncharacterized protein PUNSTDRAFT_137246 [Punctularia strigosozonata HHB-11173 SS5]EIN05753.1 hypothetical protein PUNSTDRAFT_137246 [Punctularia strigosozonata HHB-11173 SS5]
MSPFTKSWSIGGRRKGSADAENNAHTIAPASSSNSSFESLRSNSPKSHAVTPDLAAQIAAHQHREELISQFWGGKPEKKAKPARASPPPAYAETERLPAYPDMSGEDSVNQAKWSWRNGFLFPPFWIIGIIILCSPLRVEESWHADKSDDERKLLVLATRQEEMKYGKRCLWAFLAFLAISAVVATIVLMIAK